VAHREQPARPGRSARTAPVDVTDSAQESDSPSRSTPVFAQCVNVKTPVSTTAGYREANSAMRPRMPFKKRGLSSVDICLASSTASVMATGSSISVT
jgi:hypothetical protein